MVAPSRVAGSRADYVFPRLDWSHDRREDKVVTVVEKAPAVAGPGLADRDDECGDSRPIGPKP